MARLGAAGSGSPLAGLVDASRTAILGYSMGGYGVVNVIGGGYRDEAAALPGRAAQRPAAGSRGLEPRLSRRGSTRASRPPSPSDPGACTPAIWDAAGLAGIRTPMLFVAGSVDDVSGYEKGTRAIFDGAVNSDRYLLTFLDANHNAARANPRAGGDLRATPRR